MKQAIFPGSFNPFTLGHKDILDRALTIFDKVIVAIGINAEKTVAADAERRAEKIRACYVDNPNVEVRIYSGLTVDLCRECDVYTLIRGIRDCADWEYERKMADVNRMLDSRVETIYLQTSPQYASISSSVVREIEHYGGDVSQLIP